jgi:hypothetical protein
LHLVKQVDQAVAVKIEGLIGWVEAGHARHSFLRSIQISACDDSHI